MLCRWIDPEYRRKKTEMGQTKIFVCLRVGNETKKTVFTLNTLNGKAIIAVVGVNKRPLNKFSSSNQRGKLFKFLKVFRGFKKLNKAVDLTQSSQ